MAVVQTVRSDKTTKVKGFIGVGQEIDLMLVWEGRANI